LKTKSIIIDVDLKFTVAFFLKVAVTSKYIEVQFEGVRIIY